MEIIQYTQFVNKQETEGVTFVQFSDKLLTPNSKTRDYYRRAYSKMEGYYFPEHYMEIPFWIPTIAGMLPDSRFRKSLHIVKDIEESARVFDVMDDSEKLLFSVMNANVRQVCEIVERTKKQAIMGGYTDPSEFSGYDNVHYLKGLEDLAEVFDANIGVPPDYSLFRREKCIPRVTLSTGCLFRCTFCTVPTTLTISSDISIREQVEALRPLDFKLIFIDDKSFSQANNWRKIGDIDQQVKGYNPFFLGFIVQTPPTLANKEGFLEEANSLGLRYIELGVETVNDHYLEKFNKAFRVKQLDLLTDKIRKLDLKIIPNLIMGIPGDNYYATIEWISRNRDIIPVVNVNFLAAHYGNERGQFPYVATSVGDRDQNTPEKSWLTSDEVKRMIDAVDIIYQLTTER